MNAPTSTASAQNSAANWGSGMGNQQVATRQGMLPQGASTGAAGITPQWPSASAAGASGQNQSAAGQMQGVVGGGVGGVTRPPHAGVMSGFSASANAQTTGATGGGGFPQLPAGAASNPAFIQQYILAQQRAMVSLGTCLLS